jgi:hypothetical protein
MPEVKNVRPVVSSVGMDTRNAIVIRLVMPNGAIRYVGTNAKSMAELAAAGVQVRNGI